jgi:hypothetical protein
MDEGAEKGEAMETVTIQRALAERLIEELLCAYGTTASMQELHAALSAPAGPLTAEPTNLPPGCTWVPWQGKRVESGPMQFGDDWPGAFIRGDSAGWYAFLLRQLLEDKNTDLTCRMNLPGLVSTLAGCIVGPARELVHAPAWTGTQPVVETTVDKGTN